MAKYTGVILTNKGKELLARAILGEVIVFTKVEIGEGVLLPGTDKEALISLVNSFKSLSITSTTNLPNGGYRIRISFNNKGFMQDKYLREVGIYARGEDGIEILYSYCNTDTPNLIPNESSGIIESVEDIITYISNAATINAVIDQSNVYATIKDLVEGLATKEDKFTKNDAFNRSFSHVISSTSKILVASAYAVKTAYDKGVTALNRANEAYTLASGKEPNITKKTGFNLDKSDLVTSTSSILLATAKAVKIAYDKGLEALGLANTNKVAILNTQEQIESLYTEILEEKVLFDGSNFTLGVLELTDDWDKYNKILFITEGSSGVSIQHREFKTKYIIASDNTSSNGVGEHLFCLIGSHFKSGCFRDTNRNEIYITESASTYIKKIIGIGKIL